VNVVRTSHTRADDERKNKHRSEPDTSVLLLHQREETRYHCMKEARDN
jgi:hypothetical protein